MKPSVQIPWIDLDRLLEAGSSSPKVRVPREAEAEFRPRFTPVLASTDRLSGCGDRVFDPPRVAKRPDNRKAGGLDRARAVRSPEEGFACRFDPTRGPLRVPEVEPGLAKILIDGHRLPERLRCPVDPSGSDESDTQLVMVDRLARIEAATLREKIGGPRKVASRGSDSAASKGSLCGRCSRTQQFEETSSERRQLPAPRLKFPFALGGSWASVASRVPRSGSVLRRVT
jgi:hypothetical protein